MISFSHSAPIICLVVAKFHARFRIRNKCVARANWTQHLSIRMNRERGWGRCFITKKKDCLLFYEERSHFVQLSANLRATQIFVFSVNIFCTNMRVPKNTSECVTHAITPEFTRERGIYMEKKIRATSKGKRIVRKWRHWKENDRIEVRRSGWGCERGFADKLTAGLRIGFRSRLEFNSRHGRPRGMNKIRIRFILPSPGNVPRLPHFAARRVGNSERVRFYSTHYIE